MSLIKIAHHTKDTLSQDVSEQLQQLSPHTLAPYFQQYGTESGRIAHCFTIASHQTILGFALLSTLNDTATLHAIFIKKEFRDKSLGTKMTLHLLSKCTKFGCKKIILESNKSQLKFFQRLGFVTVKEPNHHTTLFQLENPCPEYFLSVYKQTIKEKQRQHANTNEPLVLSQDKTLYNFHEEAQFLALHRNMLSQAKRRIWIMANTINASVLNDEQFRQSIMQLAKNNSQAEIKILLEDGKTNAGHFSPLVSLAQRLSSFVEIRSLPASSHKFNEWVTVVDFSAGIYRKTLDSYSGFATYDSKLIAQRLITKFDDHWQFAKPSAEFRRLAI